MAEHFHVGRTSSESIWTSTNREAAQRYAKRLQRSGHRWASYWSCDLTVCEVLG